MGHLCSTLADHLDSVIVNYGEATNIGISYYQNRSGCVNDQLPYLSPKCSFLDRMLLPLSSLTGLSDGGVLDSGYLLFSVSMIGVGSMGCLICG